MDRRRVGAAVATTVVLAVASTAVIAAADGAFRCGWRAPSGDCRAPSLPGNVVDATLMDMGRAPMHNGIGGHMRLIVNRTSVCNLPGHYAAGMYTQLTVM